MNTLPIVAGLAIAAAGFAAEVRAADPEGVAWIIQYDGRNPPASPTWTSVGQAKAAVVDSALHVVDDSDQECCFRAGWQANPASEIVVEARVKVVSMKGFRGGQSVWPWRDGAPIGLLISDGRRQEGLVLTPSGVRTFTDRFFRMKTTDAFHDYRLVIHEGDMSVEVDGKRVIRGIDAFWKPADSPDPFLQFGSSAKTFTSDAHWQYVRLGVRKPASAPEPPRLKITLGEPWEITRADKVRHTRPYLYNMGQGLLLMSVAQGPDAIYEPYGVLKSTDEGKTWTPIPGLDQIEYAPLPMLRLKDGAILGVSRWSRKQAEGVFSGRTVRFDARAEQFTMIENKIFLPDELIPLEGRVMVFDRHIFLEPDGTILAACYGVGASGMRSFILKTTDGGATWRHYSTMPPRGGEPGVARLSTTEMTALLRQNSSLPFCQIWSHDGGRTWSEPAMLEEGRVDPDVELMSNGVLACSYGRPASCIMFSLDQGKTWTSHRVVSDETGFNYTSLQEIHPGRLLYVHDAPTLRALYIDVERIGP